MLFRSKHRRAAYATYLKEAVLKINLPSGINYPHGLGRFIEKHFCVFIGIGGLGTWPYARKVQRTPNYRSQFLFRPGTFKPMWLEFIPVKGSDQTCVPCFTPSTLCEREKLDGRIIRRWRNKEERAKILLYEIANDSSVAPRETPFTDSVPNWYSGIHDHKEESKGQRSQPSTSWSQENPSPFRHRSPTRSPTPPWRHGREQASSSRDWSNWHPSGWEQDRTGERRSDWWERDRSRSSQPDPPRRYHQGTPSSSQPFNIYGQERGDRSWRDR